MTQAIETQYFGRVQPFAALRRLLCNWRQRRRLRGLEALDDHILKDIGLSRADVTAVLGQPINVDPLSDLEHRVWQRRRESMPEATSRWLRDRAYAHPRLDSC